MFAMKKNTVKNLYLQKEFIDTTPALINSNLQVIHSRCVSF